MIGHLIIDSFHKLISFLVYSFIFKKYHFPPSMEIYEILLTKRQCHVTNKLCRKALVEKHAHSECMLNSCILLSSNILMPPLSQGGNLYKVNKVFITISNVHDIFKFLNDISFLNLWKEENEKNTMTQVIFQSNVF